jgi:hypothetical protein
MGGAEGMCRIGERGRVKGGGGGGGGGSITTAPALELYCPYPETVGSAEYDSGAAPCILCLEPLLCISGATVRPTRPKSSPINVSSSCRSCCLRCTNLNQNLPPMKRRNIKLALITTMAIMRSFEGTFLCGSLPLWDERESAIGD